MTGSRLTKAIVLSTAAVITAVSGPAAAWGGREGANWTWTSRGYGHICLYPTPTGRLVSCEHRQGRGWRAHATVKHHPNGHRLGQGY